MNEVDYKPQLLLLLLFIIIKNNTEYRSCTCQTCETSSFWRNL